MISNTFASTYPYYAFTTHQIFSSSESKICLINYLCLSKVNFVPVVKYGVKFNNWVAVYFPGGKRRFYKELDSAKLEEGLFLSICVFIFLF